MYDLQKKGKPGIRAIFYGLFCEFVLIPCQDLIQQSIIELKEESLIHQYSLIFDNYNKSKKDYMIRQLLLDPIRMRLTQSFSSIRSFNDLCFQYTLLRKNYSNLVRDYPGYFCEWLQEVIVSHQTDFTSSINLNDVELDDLFFLLSLFSESILESMMKSLQEAAHSFIHKQVTTEDLKNFSSPAVYEKGKVLCSLVEGLRKMRGCDLSALVTIPKLSLYIHLTLHHSLQQKEKEWIGRSSDLLMVFPKEDFIYYSLFLWRWNSRCIDKQVEIDLGNRLCSISTCANIQAILSGSGFVNEMLITPYIGHYGYVLSLDELNSYPMLKKYVQSNDNRNYHIHTQLGSCCLLVDNYKIQCCPAQLLLLLLFSDSDSLSINEVISRSPFQPSITRKILDSLTCCSIGLFRVSLPKLSNDVILPSLLSLDLDEEIEEKKELTLFDVSERFVLRVIVMNRMAAWIIKGVKSKKQLSQTAIIKYVLNHDNTFSRDEIKKTIEVLIEREYLSRKESNSEMIMYNI